MYLVKEYDFVDKFSPFGLMAFNNHYHGKTVEDVRNFVSDVVIKGDDTMREQREAFFKQYLAPRDGKLPSEKIIEILNAAIKGEVIK